MRTHEMQFDCTNKVFQHSEISPLLQEGTLWLPSWTPLLTNDSFRIFCFDYVVVLFGLDWDRGQIIKIQHRKMAHVLFMKRIKKNKCEQI
jgi:hypothetical protein